MSIEEIAKNIALEVAKVSPNRGDYLIVRDKDRKMTGEDFTRVRDLFSNIKNKILFISGDVEIGTLSPKKGDLIVVKDSANHPVDPNEVGNALRQVGIYNQVMVTDYEIGLGSQQ